MVLASGDWVHSPVSPTLARASPRAPLPLANSSSLSASARDRGCAAGMTIALTMPPCWTASRSIGTPPSPPWAVTMSVRTTCSSPKRRSGLSLPYFAIDSSNGIRRKGVGTSTPRTSFHSRTMSFSTTAKTSSWLTKLISRSIWVNSGWRSRRRSSSRKHLTIWK